MKLLNKKNIIPVSIIIPMRNSETTILKTLKSLRDQIYPIYEIVVVDNASIDKSVTVVDKYRNKYKKIPIKILKNSTNIGVGGSYNRGVANSKSQLIVFMHSDSMLETPRELNKLILPFKKDSKVIATYSSIILPRRVWATYNFWQKVLSCRAVDKKQPGLNGKFDCFLKSVFLKIGGFNVEQYGQHIEIGSEDADLHMRLLKVGRVVKAKSTVTHLHYLGNNYSIGELFKNRKLLARSYGRLLRLEHIKLGLPIFYFLIKPLLVLLLLIPYMYPANLLLITFYIFWYYYEMYKSEGTRDIRIITLPFVTIILLICEVYWMSKGFLYFKKVKG